METIGQFINGQHIFSADEATFETLNPATGQKFATVAIASSLQINQAIDTALEGFRVWSEFPPVERARILHKAAAILRSRVEELAKYEVQDTGKPIQEALDVDVHSGADCLEYFASLAQHLHGEHIPQKNRFIYTKREPLGVCAGIGAWNYPLQIACWKAAPALACGNAMVFKPSELTPVTAMYLAEILLEAGCPPGVFNVLQGDATVGKALCEHPGIAKVSLTGEVATGKKIMQQCSGQLKKITMELGGKSPFIVFADAHLDNAVSAALLANFYTQGEICSNGTRVFVEKSIKDQFLEKLVKRTQNIIVGDPMNPETQMGALISRAHLEKVLSYVEKGKSEGATLLCGGAPLTQAPFAEGAFMTPAIFADCQDEMTIVKEEIFGPVMSVLDFDTEAEVVERANNTDFGLAAGVFTQDMAKAHRVIDQVQAGTCWINDYNQRPIEMPFGGYKQSGLGRENGHAALEHYTQLKSVYVNLADVEGPF